jgi:predicted Zn-dependent peptidase
MRTELVSDDEMATAKARYFAEVLASSDSFDASLQELIGIAIHHLPADESSRRLARVLAMTKEDIRDAASKYLVSERLRVFVEGDAAGIKGQIVGLGLCSPNIIGGQRP